MAEIKLQPKKPATWLWLIGIFAVVGLVWVIMVLTQDDRFDETATAVVPSAPPLDTAPTSGIRDTPPADVAAFLTFAQTPVGSAIGTGHEYAAGGIRRLSRALNAVIEEKTVAGNPVREQFAAFQAKADRIRADPQATGHAEQVRDVFTSAADMMSAVQKERWPNAAELQTRIAAARAAGESIDAGRPLLDQNTEVRTFFDRAAAALRVMSESTS